jgi:hypothetical protein
MLNVIPSIFYLVPASVPFQNLKNGTNVGLFKFFFQFVLNIDQQMVVGTTMLRNAFSITIEILVFFGRIGLIKV